MRKPLIILLSTCVLFAATGAIGYVAPTLQTASTAPCKPGDFPVACPASGDFNQATHQFDVTNDINLPGRVARIHYSVLAPGGVIPQHPHKNRPCMEYMLEGEATETKIDSSGKVSVRVVKTDEVEIEGGDVTHWWTNEGTRTARMIAVDIFENPNAKFCNCAPPSRTSPFVPPASPSAVRTELLGEIDLSVEYPSIPSMAGYKMRSRRLTVAPGETSAVETSQGRPSYTYVVRGSPVENRSDREPSVLRPEEFTFAEDGTSYFWHNPTAEPVVLWVVDFVKLAPDRT